jgi:hypothetical protein
MIMPAYQARSIKRRRRTQAQVEQLESQIHDVLAADHPQSVRHVFYRMTDPRLPEPVEKTDQGYQQVVNRLTKMRREGRIPYGWITDATRRGYHVETYEGKADFIRRMAGLYRSDIWSSAENYVEVWCESRSIAGVIEADCEEMAVSLYPAAGFSSITLCYEAAQYINHATDHGEQVANIIYIGDFDPAGVLIDRQIENEIWEHLDGEIDLHLHRIAITPEQIKVYDLPTKPRKSGDRRARYIQETVEAEAMPAALMHRLLREKVDEFLPTNALNVAKVAEESERAGLLALAQAVEETGL